MAQLLSNWYRSTFIRDQSEEDNLNDGRRLVPGMRIRPPPNTELFSTTEEISDDESNASNRSETNPLVVVGPNVNNNLHQTVNNIIPIDSKQSPEISNNITDSQTNLRDSTNSLVSATIYPSLHSESTSATPAPKAASPKNPTIIPDEKLLQILNKAAIKLSGNRNINYDDDDFSKMKAKTTREIEMSVISGDSTEKDSSDHHQLPLRTEYYLVQATEPQQTMARLSLKSLVVLDNFIVVMIACILLLAGSVIIIQTLNQIKSLL